MTFIFYTIEKEVLIRKKAVQNMYEYSVNYYTLSCVKKFWKYTIT